MRIFLPLSLSLLLPIGAGAQASVSAPWDITETISALSQQTTRLQPVLDQLTPQEWVKNGAPEAYVSQWQSARNELGYVADASKALQKQPEKLSSALTVYFRLQALESRLNSLVEGVRKYQNPAVGDLIVGIVAENTGNREKLQSYLSDLAEQKEQEFDVVDKEAQRCRTVLNRQPAAPKPPAPKPAVKSGAK